MKIVTVIFNVVLHTVAAAGIIFVFYPMASWYFDGKPLWGVDFFYTASLTNMLKSNLVLPPGGWGYAWFAGWPFQSNYPVLHYYLILPFTYFFPLIAAVKLWMLASLGLFFVGAYFLFYKLSHSFAVSFVLAVAGIYSVGVYGTMMWGGSLPSHANQAFLPWVALFIVLFLNTNRTKHLLTAALLTGLAIWGHPQVVIAYIYPVAGILFLFWFADLKLLNRIKSLIIYLTISFLIGLPLFYSSFGNVLKVLFVTNSAEVASSTARVPTQAARDVAAFHHAQPYRIFIDTNPVIFYFLGIAITVFLIGLVLFRRFHMIKQILPFVILLVYFVIYVWIFAYGISIYHGGWYRLFWTTPIWLGMFIAALWGSPHFHAQQRLVKFSKYFHATVFFINVVILVTGTYIVLTYFSTGVKERIVPRSNPSSAYPDIINLYGDGNDLEKLRTRMVPDWLDPNQTNFRLYDADQTVNIWWNSLYKMPLARGYFDPPLNEAQRGYLFWTDAALNQDPKTGLDQLESNFKYPGEAAFNNTLFLIDWNAIKYFEIHAGPTAYSPVPKNLTTETFIANQTELDFNAEKYTNGDKRLHYFALKDEYTSPILSATNALTLGIVASAQGYETIMRDLADVNISSKKLIPLHLGQNLDELNGSDLTYMDGLIVYDYQYKNRDRVFRLLNDYAKKGRKIFIETGTEVRESNSFEALPELFPVNKTFRKSLGNTWDLQAAPSEITKDIDFSKFDPPIFDQADWNLSFPQSHGDIRPNSNIILTQKDNPILITHKIGEGEVIWSGINLPYHISRNHNLMEVALFRNLLNYLIPAINSPIAPVSSDVKFISPQKRMVSASQAKGVLFKEQDYPGWTAKLTSGGKNTNAKIFKAGPTYPGFIYIPVPQAYQSNFTAYINYQGSSISWFLFWVAVVIVLFCLDEILLGSNLLGRFRRFAWKRLRLRLSGWWGKEDEQ